MMTKATMPTAVAIPTKTQNPVKTQNTLTQNNQKEYSFKTVMGKQWDEKPQAQAISTTKETKPVGTDTMETNQLAVTETDQTGVGVLKDSTGKVPNQQTEADTEASDFSEPELEQIAALAASLQGLLANISDPKEKLAAVNDLFCNILGKIEEDALDSGNKLSGKKMDQLINLIQLLTSEKPVDQTTDNGVKSILELLMKLVNELNDVTSTKSEGKDTDASAMDTATKLLVLLNSILSKPEQLATTATETKTTTAIATDQKKLNPLVELVINRTSQLLKNISAQSQDGTLNQLVIDNGDTGKQLADTLEAIMLTAKTNEGDKTTVKEVVETLIQNLFTTAKPETNKTAGIEEILKKFETVLTSVKTSETPSVDELKKNLTKVLIMLTDKVDAGNGTDQKKDNSIVEKFSKILEQNLTNKVPVAAQSQDSKTSNEDSKKNTNTQEDKLLNRILGNQDNNDGKSSKLNLIAQMNGNRELDIDKIADKPVVTKANFTQDIIKTVKYMNLNNLKELTVKIAPKDLGEITIKLILSDGNMKANISANSKEAFGLLSSSVAEIKSSLESTTIRIQDVEINIYQEDASFTRENGRGQDNRNPDNKQSSNGRAQEDASEFEISPIVEDNNISILI